MLSTQNKNKYGGNKNWGSAPNRRVDETSTKNGGRRGAKPPAGGKHPTQKPLEKPKKFNPVSELPEIDPLQGCSFRTGEEPKKNMYTYI